MKNTALILVLLFLASCGSQKMRFVRAPKLQKQEIVALKKSENVPAKHEREKVQEISESVELTPENSITISHEETSDEQLKEVELNETAILPPPAKTDSVQNTDEEIAAIAKKAESIGRNALLFRVLSTVVVFAGVILSLILWEEIFVLITFGLALLLSITAVVLGIKSKREPYNTKKGSRMAMIAIFWSIPSILLSLLVLALAL